MKDGVRAWISGGCVPLVQVSPISARTDGVQDRGMGRGSLAGRSGWPVRVEDSEFEKESSSLEAAVEDSSVSSFHPVCRCTRLHSPLPILYSPAADRRLVSPWAAWQLAAYLMVCMYTMHLGCYGGILNLIIMDSYDPWYYGRSSNAP